MGEGKSPQRASGRDGRRGVEEAGSPVQPRGVRQGELAPVRLPAEKSFSTPMGPWAVVQHALNSASDGLDVSSFQI